MWFAKNTQARWAYETNIVHGTFVSTRLGSIRSLQSPSDPKSFEQIHKKGHFPICGYVVLLCLIAVHHCANCFPNQLPAKTFLSEFVEAVGINRLFPVLCPQKPLMAHLKLLYRVNICWATTQKSLPFLPACTLLSCLHVSCCVTSRTSHSLFQSDYSIRSVNQLKCSVYSSIVCVLTIVTT